MKSSLALVLLVAVGVAVADVSELSRRYLPPAAVNNGFADFAVTDAPVAETEVTTTPAGTTIVEIEQVPLEEMHFKEEEQQQSVQMTEQPSLPSVYEQKPALIYETPIYEAQTEVTVAPSVEETPMVEEVPAVEEEKAPIAEDVFVMEEAPKNEEVTKFEESSIGMDLAVSEPSTDVESGSAVDPAEVAVAEEATIVNEAPEVPVPEAEPEPAHVLAKDGYRYKTGNHFHYRF